MSQHERQRLWRAECRGCGEEYVAVGRTNKEATSELKAFGWVEDEIGWYCAECCTPTPNETTQR